MSEKNLPPTRKRLEDARKKGQTAQVPSIPQMLSVAAVFEAIAQTSDRWLFHGPQLLGSFVERLGDAHTTTPVAVKDLLVPLGWLGLSLALCALLLACLMSMIGNLVQVGFKVSAEGVARLERLSPASYLKRVFSVELLSMLLMNAAKVTVIVICTGGGVLMSLDSLLRLADGTLMQAAQAVLDTFVLCERMTLGALIAFVAIDWTIRRSSHMRSLRMSRQDVDVEHKDQFGDKHVRQHHQQWRRDMLAGQLTENTRKANAVVTNPTHFAVALLYEPAKYPLPVVVARGADKAAGLIRVTARDAGIPVIRSPQLARMLYSVGREWRPVPRLALKAVAAIYRLVAEIRAGERKIDEVLEVDDVDLGPSSSYRPPP